MLHKIYVHVHTHTFCVLVTPPNSPTFTRLCANAHVSANAQRKHVVHANFVSLSHIFETYWQYWRIGLASLAPSCSDLWAQGPTILEYRRLCLGTGAELVALQIVLLQASLNHSSFDRSRRVQDKPRAK